MDLNRKGSVSNQKMLESGNAKPMEHFTPPLFLRDKFVLVSNY
jgi:hypothetical protein